MSIELNNTNYSKYIIQKEQDDSIDFSISSNWNEKPGCNGFVRGLSAPIFSILIPKIRVQQVLEEIEIKSGIKYSFQDILDIFYEDMGFKYEVTEVSFDIRVEFLEREAYTDFYVITMNTAHYEGKSLSPVITRYYSFTMIRLFYYYQLVLINYIILRNEFKEISDRVIILSVLTILFNSRNNFIDSMIPIYSDLTFEKCRELYIKNKSNYCNIPNTIILRLVENDFVDDILDISKENFSSIIEKIKAYNNNIKNFMDFPKNIKVDDVNVGNFIQNFITKDYEAVSTTISSSNIKINISNIKYKVLDESSDTILLKKGIEISTQKIADLKSVKYLYISEPKIVLNFSKVFKETLPYIINSKDSFNKVKDIEFIKTSLDEKSIKFPVRIRNKIKYSNYNNNINIRVNNKKELEKVKKSFTREYILTPVIPYAETHLLYISKLGLFYHQIIRGDYITDKYSKNYSKRIPKNMQKIIKECINLFEKSKLDVGVIEVSINRNGDYIIEDIDSYNSKMGFMGVYNYINFINDNLNDIICVD